MDAIVLQLSNHEICEASMFFFQAELTPADGLLCDISPLIYSNSSLPTPAYLLLAFWDTLPASTPIQLLRRWDGAHTGPYGQRHGLKSF